MVVGAEDWYCDDEHTVSVEQVRSDVEVAAVDWYCMEEHTVNKLHCRSEVAVDATI